MARAMCGALRVGVALTLAALVAGQSATPTVTVSPANNAVVTFTGATGTVGATMAAQTTRQSLLFNPGAFAFVMVDLPAKLPGAVSYRARAPKAKLSIRWAEQYNINTDQMPSRADVIYGAAAILPYFAMRFYS